MLVILEWRWGEKGMGNISIKLLSVEEGKRYLGNDSTVCSCLSVIMYGRLSLSNRLSFHYARCCASCMEHVVMGNKTVYI